MSSFCIFLILEITKFRFQFFDFGFEIAMSKIWQLRYSSLKSTETFRDAGKYLIYTFDPITGSRNLGGVVHRTRRKIRGFARRKHCTELETRNISFWNWLSQIQKKRVSANKNLRRNWRYLWDNWRACNWRIACNNSTSCALLQKKPENFPEKVWPACSTGKASSIQRLVSDVLNLFPKCHVFGSKTSILSCKPSFISDSTWCNLSNLTITPMDF